MNEEIGKIKIPNSLLKFAARILAIYFAIVLFATIAMCVVYSLPVGRIKKHVKESVWYFRASDKFGYQKPVAAGGLLDDFTDALMLLEAAHKSEKSVATAAMLAERPVVSGKNPYQSLVSIYGDGNKEFNIVSYGRFWHGYQIILKPLLLFFNYLQIRYLNVIVQCILVITLISMLAKRNQYGQLISFAGTWLFLNPASLFLSMTYTAEFIIVMIELIAIFHFSEKYENHKDLCIYHFFVTGCLIAFFDYLISPLTTFGIPAAFLLLQNKKSFKESFFLLVKTGIAWAAGYLLMWGAKWLVGTAITGVDIVKQAKNSIAFRSGSVVSGERISYFDVLRRNLTTGQLAIPFLAACGIFAFNTVRGKTVPLKNFVFLLLTPLPFAWYFAAKNHSYIHSWMTFRVLGITVCSILAFAVSMEKTDSDRRRKTISTVLFCLIPLLCLVFSQNSFDGVFLERRVLRDGRQIYDSERVKIFRLEDSIYYVTQKSNDNSKRYFLHLYTDDPKFEDKKTHGFVNRDFNFEKFERKVPAWHKTRIAKVRLSEFAVTKMRTGQFETDKSNDFYPNRYWETLVEFSD